MRTQASSNCWPWGSFRLAVGLVVGYELTAAPLRDSAISRTSFQCAGNSDYVAIDANGQQKRGDRNLFSIVIQDCAWRMTLRVPDAPNRPSEIADDGTNSYIFAQGSGGTTTIGTNASPTRYVDSATIDRSGEIYPRHHGIAVWLLFGGDCFMPVGAGAIGRIFEQGNPKLSYSYERLDDPAKNSLGPALVRIFLQPVNKAVCELEVTESRQESGLTLPRSAELRMLNGSRRGKGGQVAAIYRLTNISIQRAVGAKGIRPELTNTTSILDRRFASTFEYISSSWLNEAEAHALFTSGRVYLHPPNP